MNTRRMFDPSRQEASFTRTGQGLVTTAGISLGNGRGRRVKGIGKKSRTTVGHAEIRAVRMADVGLRPHQILSPGTA